MKTDILNDLQKYTDYLLEKHQIPAISIAILRGEKLHEAASGCLNIDTGVEATKESIFQIGSIAKVFTASLVMQLVDEGRVELDKPVMTYIRDFQVADAEATKSITVRQLLTHTSGIMGDFFPKDSYSGGNPIARYVDRCNLLPQIHAPGELYSYSNSAYGIVGRLIEVMLGMSWFEAIEERIFKPLEMKHSVVSPEKILHYRAAAGHVLNNSESETTWKLPSISHLTMGLAPAGSTLTMSAADLIKFAKAHLNEGLTRSGDVWLSPGSIREMQTEQVRLPAASNIYDKYTCLGWGKSLVKSSGATIIGHSGATEGYGAILQLIPSENLAYAILVNGSKRGVLDAIQSELIGLLAGIDCREPELKEIELDLKDLKLFTGTFESFDRLCRITLSDNQLVANIDYKIDPLPPLKLFLSPIGKNCFTAVTEKGERQPNIVFKDFETPGPQPAKNPRYVYLGGRLNSRV